MSVKGPGIFSLPNVARALIRSQRPYSDVRIEPIRKLSARGDLAGLLWIIGTGVEHARVVPIVLFGELPIDVRVKRCEDTIQIFTREVELHRRQPTNLYELQERFSSL